MKELKYRYSENKEEEIPKPKDLHNEISKKYLQIWRKVPPERKRLFHSVERIVSV